jgi:hypothetical protein
MKNSSSPVSKSSSRNSRKRQDESPLQGHLFLGHKLLAELRILMRLSSGTTSTTCGNFKSANESSF